MSKAFYESENPDECDWNRDCFGMMRRIQRELKEMTSDPPMNCSAGPKGDNLYEWVATIVGPAESPYESGMCCRTLFSTPGRR